MDQNFIALFTGAGGFFIGEVMSFNLAEILEAVGRLVVTLDQHPGGAVFLIALAALIGMPALAWLLKR
ncbi:hypothetical protein DBR37_05815 [Herminiimonas sp. KBW02]|uniref:hypothetical protein n=1 Tax=Herminiimonas sp. KBW02 TaxID=2153363 RepID=UPI000F5AFA07|nr:hypothetical protein [Herminiimonas sp. KBW02]RQO35875.1 hypothetical protein DBR37_05815 [Herminiimonas sp. KBW02]